MAKLREQIVQQALQDANKSPVKVMMNYTQRNFGAKMQLAGEKVLTYCLHIHNYITQCYGLTARVSDSGDTFTYKRDRYLKIQLGGKTLKCFNNIQNNDLDNDSPFSLEEHNLNSLSDLPGLYRITSDLALKREKIIIDKMMEKAGITKKQEDYTLESVPMQIKEKEMTVERPSTFNQIEEKDD